MTLRPLHIAIAGCGPAGLAAALLLHRDGHRVELFDRFAEPQPIGSGLMIQPTGLAVLDRLGLAERLVERGAPVARLFGLEEHGRVALDARYGDLPIPGVFGLGVHRSSLFDLLHAAVRAVGLPFHGGRAIGGSRRTGVGRLLVFDGGETSDAFDLVVDALGTRSPLSPGPLEFLRFGALWATVPWPEDDAFDATLLEQRYRRARQMVGMLPIGRRSPDGPREAAFFWSLEGDSYAQWQSRGLPAWKDEVLRLWPACEAVLPAIADPTQLTFARYAHRTTPQPGNPTLVRIGDAWHSASPQLGQGANMALLDAWALAVGLRAAGTAAEGLRRMRAWRTDHVRLYQLLTAGFTPLYQSSGSLAPAIRDRILAPLGRIWPAPRIQASMVTGLFGAPLGELGLAVPDYEALAAIASSASARASSPAQS